MRILGIFVKRHRLRAVKILPLQESNKEIQTYYQTTLNGPMTLKRHMITSSNEIIFRVIGPLCE